MSSVNITQFVTLKDCLLYAWDQSPPLQLGISTQRKGSARAIPQGWLWRVFMRALPSPA